MYRYRRYTTIDESITIDALGGSWHKVKESESMTLI